MSEILTIRASSGLSGDMLLTGLARMAEAEQTVLDNMVEAMGVDALKGCVRLEARSVNEVAGFGAVVELPHEHAHRNMTAIAEIVNASAMPEAAREMTLRCFELLARAEAAVHGKSPEEVCFHEVGALDSILDIGVACQLLARLNPARVVCSPLPLADGGVFCAHGWLPTPAPAVLRLLEGVPVCAFAGKGETVTPTAIALLKAFGTEFGPWPSMQVRAQCLVYGGKVFENAPNGAIFALGPAGFGESRTGFYGHHHADHHHAHHDHHGHDHHEHHHENHHGHEKHGKHGKHEGHAH